MSLIAEIMATWENYNIETKVLAASNSTSSCIGMYAVRSTHSYNAHKTFRQLMSHPLTNGPCWFHERLGRGRGSG